MSLPLELIDRILGHLSDDSESLKAMSLVSKAWVSWCQARLFKSIRLTPYNHDRFKIVSQEIDGPASHTRTLTLEENRFVHWINPQYPYFPLSNLASFTHVRSLSFIQWDTTRFRGPSLENHFGHFGKSLRSLSLQFCTFDPVTLFDFFSLLPNVDDLELACYSRDPTVPHTIPDVPEVTPNFCGTLSLGNLTSVHLHKALATFPLRFSTIRIKDFGYDHFYEQDAHQPLFTSCRDTLVTLLLVVNNSGVMRICSGLLHSVLTTPIFQICPSQTSH
jgi:hypothetical protein